MTSIADYAHRSFTSIGWTRESTAPVAVDTTYDHGSAVLVRRADGTANIYFSNGGGAIGGPFHEQVSAAAKSPVERSADFIALTAAAPGEQLPAAGYTTLFCADTHSRSMRERPVRRPAG